MNTGLYVLLIYIIALLGIAWYAATKDEKNIKDFATTSSGLGIFVLTLTFCATYHSAYAFMGATGFVFKNGIGWWCNGIWTVLPGILFWVWGRRFWFLGKKYGFISMSQYISDVYQSNLAGLLASIVVLVFTIPYVAMQAIGSGYIFNVISGGSLNYAVGTFIFFGIMVILVWLGGMKGVAITDAMQGVFMWIGMIVGSYLVLHVAFGSVTNAYAEAYKVLPSLFTLPGPGGVITGADWVSRWIIITVGMMMFPHIVLRFFSGKSLRVLKWSAVASSIYLTSIYIFTPAVGFIGHILYPGTTTPDTIFPELLLQYTPVLFAAIIIAGALAASMSTGDSQLHAASTVVSVDIYKEYIKKDASEYQQYKVAKLVVLFLGIISLLVALQKPGLLGNILALSTGGVAALAPTMIGGLYWKKATKEGAIWSIIAGELALVLTTFVIKSPFGIMSGLWGLIVSFIVFVIICSFTTPHARTAEIIDSINDFFVAEPGKTKITASEVLDV